VSDLVNHNLSNSPSKPIRIEREIARICRVNRTCPRPSKKIRHTRAVADKRSPKEKVGERVAVVNDSKEEEKKRSVSPSQTQKMRGLAKCSRLLLLGLRRKNEEENCDRFVGEKGWLGRGKSFEEGTTKRWGPVRIEVHTLNRTRKCKHRMPAVVVCKWNC
jgi:hypothetical protein